MNALFFLALTLDNSGDTYFFFQSGVKTRLDIKGGGGGGMRLVASNLNLRLIRKRKRKRNLKELKKKKSDWCWREEVWLQLPICYHSWLEKFTRTGFKGCTHIYAYVCAQQLWRIQYCQLEKWVSIKFKIVSMVVGRGDDELISFMYINAHKKHFFKKLIFNPLHQDSPPFVLFSVLGVCVYIHTYIHR